MGRLTKQEQKARELAGEHIVECLLGRERTTKLVNENIDLFIIVSEFFYNAGVSSVQLSVVRKSLEEVLGEAY